MAACSQWSVCTFCDFKLQQVVVLFVEWMWSVLIRLIGLWGSFPCLLDHFVVFFFGRWSNTWIITPVIVSLRELCEKFSFKRLGSHLLDIGFLVIWRGSFSSICIFVRKGALYGWTMCVVFWVLWGSVIKSCWSLVRYHVSLWVMVSKSFVTALQALFCIVGVLSFIGLLFWWVWFSYVPIFFHFYLSESCFTVGCSMSLLLLA